MGNLIKIAPIEFSGSDVVAYPVDKPLFNIPLFDNETTLWIECEFKGHVIFNMEDAAIDKSLTKFTIHMPQPEVYVDINDETIENAKFIYVTERWYGTDKFTAQEQNDALEYIKMEAQKKYQNDEEVIDIARIEVESIISQRIQTYLDGIGKKRNIEFVYE